MLSSNKKDGKSNEVVDAKAAESMANTMTLTSQHDQLKPKIDNSDKKRNMKIKGDGIVIIGIQEEFDEDQSRDSSVPHGRIVGSKAGNSSSSDQEWDEFSHSALEIAPSTTEGLLNRSLDV